MSVHGRRYVMLPCCMMVFMRARRAYKELQLTRDLWVTEEESGQQPRRSSRSTKGQHSRFAQQEAEAALASPAKKRKVRQPGAATDTKFNEAAVSATHSEEDSGTVSCACGLVRENNQEMMAQCEKCFKWQHVKCLFGTGNEELLPENYECHECRPELYPKLHEQKSKKSEPIDKIKKSSDESTPKEKQKTKPKEKPADKTKEKPAPPSVPRKLELNTYDPPKKNMKTVSVCSLVLL